MTRQSGKWEKNNQYTRILQPKPLSTDNKKRGGERQLGSKLGPQLIFEKQCPSQGDLELLFIFKQRIKLQEEQGDLTLKLANQGPKISSNLFSDHQPPPPHSGALNNKYC